MLKRLWLVLLPCLLLGYSCTTVQAAEPSATETTVVKEKTKPVKKERTKKTKKRKHSSASEKISKRKNKNGNNLKEQK